ncbi:MAG TPA: hypothetical protein VGK54_12570 [Chloroflexota bacterium]
MIGEDDAVKRLMQPCPAFADVLREFLSYADGNPNEHYNTLGELARWVVSQLRAGELDCLGDLFQELEWLMANAESEARLLIVIGFIEEIQNCCVSYPTPADRIHPDLFLPYLGPRTRAAWFDIVNGPLWRERSWPGRVQDERRP